MLRRNQLAPGGPASGELTQRTQGTQRTQRKGEKGLDRKSDVRYSTPNTHYSNASNIAADHEPRGVLMARMTRREYAAMFGPTKGDAVRLGDTSLLAEIEHDYAVPGDECLHGGGKTLRDGMGLKSGFDSIDGALDMLICNATIIDPVLGIVKGDIGIKDGKIVAVGKAGNPEVMDGVHPKLICGVATTVRDTEGLVATPGGIDVHVHLDWAQLCEQ